MNISLVVAVLGTLCGVIYWVLGLNASTHLARTDVSSSDRFLSAGLLWSLSPRQYDDQGKRLCSIGSVVLLLAVCCWIGWAVLRT